MNACLRLCVCARACVRANVCVHVRVHAWSRQGRGEQPTVSGYGRTGYAPRGAARPLASTRLTILGARPCTRMHAPLTSVGNSDRRGKAVSARRRMNAPSTLACHAAHSATSEARQGRAGQGALLLEALRQVHRLGPLGLHEDCSDRRKRTEPKRTSPCAKGAPLADWLTHWARLRLGRECARARIDLQTSRE